MDQQAWNRINNLENEIRKAHTNTACLYPGCREKPISSHIIAEKTLKIIAKDGHVLTWLPTTSYTLLKNAKLEEGGEEPVEVGIGDKHKVTSPLFCRSHDQRIFAPLEIQNFSATYDQITLLTYRALCDVVLTMSETIALLTTLREQKDPLVANTLATQQRLQRIQDTNLILKDLYERMLLAQNKNQVDWIVYNMKTQPCIAATYCFIPLNGDHPKTVIDGKSSVTVEDMLAFSFLPQDQGSVCIISWLRGSQRAFRFLGQSQVRKLSEKEREDFFLSRAFESPTLYLSPLWWNSLSAEERTRLKCCVARFKGAMRH
jgi:hypothetical protein